MILVGNGRLISNDKNNIFMENGCIVIEGNIIKDIGTTDQIKYRYRNYKYEFIDANRKIIMPGMINMHNHIYSAFTRGLNLKEFKNKNFTENSKNILCKIDKKLSLEDIKYSAYTTLIENIKNGVTTVFDQHSSPTAIEGSLFQISKVAKELGIRGCYSYQTSDSNGKRLFDMGINENIEFIKHCNNSDDMAKGVFGIHASFALSNKSLEKCMKYMQGNKAGYHINIEESLEDLKQSLKISDKGTVERLMDYGILGENTIAAHCIHVNENEIDILKESNTNVINNPQSNMVSFTGRTPIIKMMDKGIRVGIGTDGYTNDMFESIKIENIIHKYNLCNPNAGSREIYKMIFENNRKIASKFYNKEIGVLEKGAYADVILVDYNPSTPINKYNYFEHILLGVSGRCVDTTIINGKVVMRNKVLINVDEERIYRKSRELARSLWKKI